MPPGAPVQPVRPASLGLVNAPPHWHVIDFISDLHLQVSQGATFAAWRHYMLHTSADAVFILGDLFEVWMGDDITQSSDTPDGAFALQCQGILHTVAQRMAVYFMHGNRDFLLGQNFAMACGMTLLKDPTVLCFDGGHWLLSHGDELCLDDVNYQQFRVQVRSEAWRNDFLAKPLTQRQAIANSLRAQSESRKVSGASYADVSTIMTLQWLEMAHADTLIHGHTHHPADHMLGQRGNTPLRRLVLSDWDAAAQPQRLQALRLRQGHTPLRVDLASGF